MDSAFEPMDRGSLEVIRRLEAFADARLQPSVAGATRMRAAVMAAAHRQAALLAADATGAVTLAVPVPGAPPDARPTHHRGGRPSWLDVVAWQRPVAAVLAGCLTLGVLAGTAFAVQPGGLLYQARIWTEAANLPAASERVARAEAEIQRLGARLDEAEAASAAGDGPATVAALDAYAAIVNEAAAGSAGDPAAEQAIQLAIERHEVALTQLATTVPATAQAAIEHALASSTRALDDIDGPPAGGNDGNGPTTNGGNGPVTNDGNGGNPGGANGGGAGNGGEKPEAAPTPTPAPTPKAPKPSPHDHTPRPTSTHQPPSQQGGPSDAPSENDQ